MNAVLRFGKISDQDFNKGMVRVELDEDSIVTHWLPFLSNSTKDDKQFSLPSINSQVACVLDSDLDRGVCLGALWSNSDMPEGFSATKRGIKFNDGSEVTYDSSSKEYTIKSVGKINIEASQDANIKSDFGGNVNVGALIEVKNQAENLKLILNEMLLQISVMTSSVPVAPGNTLVPNNAPAFVALQARVSALLK